jgi:protein KIBRA
VSSNTYGNDYDANMIKSEVSLAKQRIEKLKNELIEIEIETKQKEINVNTLDEMNHKVMNDAYSLDEALLIVNELKTIRNTITRGEQERKALIEV